MEEKNYFLGEPAYCLNCGSTAVASLTWAPLNGGFNDWDVPSYAWNRVPDDNEWCADCADYSAVGTVEQIKEWREDIGANEDLWPLPNLPEGVKIDEWQ